MAEKEIEDFAVKQGQKLASKHPLQRLDSPSRGASALLHVLGCCSAAYSFNYLISNPNAINAAWGWHLQFLTIIGLLLATLTTTLALLSDLLLSRRLFAAKNLLALASAPLACCISLLYWPLHLLDPRLLQHPDLPPLPLAADASFHLAPALFLAADLLFFSPPWTLAPLPALGLSGGVAVAYWVWVEACFARNGFYPYPMFGQLGTGGRVVLFAGAAAIMAVSALALKAVYEVVNGKGEVGRARPGEVKKGQ